MVLWNYDATCIKWRVFDAGFFQDPDLFNTYQLELFADITTIPKLLAGVSDKYHDLSIDLIEKALHLDPKQRLTAQQIVNHPLFDSVRIPIDGALDTPPIDYDYAPDYKDNLQLMLKVIVTLYPDESSQLLFLSVDLLARTNSYFKEATPEKRKVLIATCLWMADKLVSVQIVSLSEYILELEKFIPQLTIKDILDMELEIVDLLEGVINVSKLYMACDNFAEIKLSFTNVILADDPTLYARVDIPSWKAIMKEIKYTVHFKSGTIRQLIL